jgi:hypothetical protein
MNPVFIETGTFMGDGIYNAIWAGFSEIYSIELSDYLYERTLPYIKDFPNVRLIHGDSGRLLKYLLMEIDKQVTFWLDAHYSEQCTAYGPSPLFKELDAINNHYIKTHTILIDDISDYNIDEIKLLIPDYTTFEVENNILICQL